MSGYKEMSVDEVYQKYRESSRLQLIDVREEDEFAGCSISFSQILPLSQLRQGLGLDKLALQKADPVYLICRSGRRSASACEILEAAGFEQLYNVTGGILAWQERGLPVK